MPTAPFLFGKEKALGFKRKTGVTQRKISFREKIEKTGESR